MALLFLSRIDAQMERQAAALERIADALGAEQAAPLPFRGPVQHVPEEVITPEKPNMERFVVEPKRRPPRRPRTKRSGEWKPGPCPTHGKLLDEKMMCVDCYKELEEWTTEQGTKQG